MKKLIKKPVLLLGSLGALLGLGFFTGQIENVTASGSIEYCQWINDPTRPEIDGCKVAYFDLPCHCEDQC